MFKTPKILVITCFLSRFFEHLKYDKKFIKKFKIFNIKQTVFDKDKNKLSTSFYKHINT